MQRILLKTTIPYHPDDWHIGRFRRLTEHLRSLTNERGDALFAVDARDRLEDERGNDPELVHIAQSDYQQLWLFGVDRDGGLTFADLMGINLFRQQGRGLMLSRGPGDVGSSLHLLDTVGAAHCFNTVNPEADADRRVADHPQEDWPCYDSGADGASQTIRVVEPVHPLLRRTDGGMIRQLPASPREGAVEVPEGAEGFARVIATGRSRRSRREFNLAVAFEHHQDRWGELAGRALIEACFQRFSDEHLDLEGNCTGRMAGLADVEVASPPDVLADTRAYFRNIALWLAA